MKSDLNEYPRLGLENLQRWRLHSPYEQPVLLLDCPHGKFLLTADLNLSCFNLTPLCLILQPCIAV